MIRMGFEVRDVPAETPRRMLLWFALATALLTLAAVREGFPGAADRLPIPPMETR